MTTKRALVAMGVAVILAFAPPARFLRAQQLSAVSLPAAPNAKVILLNRRFGSFSEPSVAINPKDPKQLVAAFQEPASVAYSEDSGEHWQMATGTAPTNYKSSGNVSITYDILGHAILCYKAFDKLGTPRYWAHNATRNGVFVRRSLDGGKSWETNAIPVQEQSTHPSMPFEDKPYIVADNNPASPYAGSLYAGWTEFSLTRSAVLLSRSNDGGLTWSEPFEISTHEGLPRDDNGSVQGFAGATSPDGMVYAIWADGNSIVLTLSRDGGITFTPSRKILDVGSPYLKIESVERSNGFPQIAVDPRTGRLFVTWSDYRNGDVDVFCSTSPDRGTTWTLPVRINTDPIHDGSDQFHQWLAVDPSDGALNVVFYDRRNDPENRKAIIVLARSTDSGRSFVDFSWMDTSFDPDGEFLGDHTGIAASNGRIYGAWTESQSATKSLGVRPHLTVVKIGVADFQTHPR